MNFDDDDDNYADEDDGHNAADDLPFFLPGPRQFATIVQEMMSILPMICLKCRPEGSFYLGEYMSHHPDHEDQPESLCINLQTGRWSDIAANAQGFEPVSYYAHVTGLSVVAAIDALNEELDLVFGNAKRRVLM